MTRSALIIRHVPYEGIAGYRDPVEQAGFVLDRIDVCDPEFARVDLVKPDLVILMGGPMGVYDRDGNPWIACEIERLRHRLEADRPTLAVCLGAQMVAAALGSHVFPGPHQEIGFHPIDLTSAGTDSPLEALGATPVLHWHGDTFDLPTGTEWLASSARYPHQAFRRGANLLALQFHAEMGTDPRIDHWIANSGDSLASLGLDGVANSGDSLASLGLDGVAVRADYDRLGPACVDAGRSMIARWLQELA